MRPRMPRRVWRLRSSSCSASSTARMPSTMGCTTLSPGVSIPTPLLFRWPARPGGLLAHWQGPYFNRPQYAVAAEGEPLLRPLTANAFKLPVFISAGHLGCDVLDRHNPHVGPA